MTTAAALPSRLERLLGKDRLVADRDLQDYAISGRLPTSALKPVSSAEVTELVQLAVAEKLGVVCCGGRSKLEIGAAPLRYDLALDLARLKQIAHYDPADLTLSVDAGLRLAELEPVLAAQKQFLPLAVPCFESATIGGTVASGIDSATRLQYGTARDFLLGAEFVDGTGRLCKSGGRVVKNVTGYDLHKLLIGSLGTLAAVTRLNFRTFPLPELRAGYYASFDSAETALAFRKKLLGSGLPLSNVSLFDPGFAGLLRHSRGAGRESCFERLAPDKWAVFTAFAGNASVVERIQQELLKRSSAVDSAQNGLLNSPEEEAWSSALRESFSWLRNLPAEVVLIRISQLEFTSPDLRELLTVDPQPKIRRALLFDPCGNALLALVSEKQTTPELGVLELLVQQLQKRLDGKKSVATLLHAPLSVKQHCHVWGDPRPNFSMMQRVKAAFDPQKVFSPGRYLGGI